MVIALLYALDCICIKGQLLSPKGHFLVGKRENQRLSLCFATFVEIFPHSLTVSTNPAQSIKGEQTMTNIQREIKVN